MPHRVRRGGSDAEGVGREGREVLYSEEVVWSPKENSDPDYHLTHCFIL